MDDNSSTRVALACQGGGSHTAFTAGVLEALLEELPERVEVVALSGTSGGAICATLAWDGFVHGDPRLAVPKLEGFWKAMAATETWDQLANQSLLSIMGLRDLMVLPEVSPYSLPPWGEEKMRAILNQFLNFAELRALAQRAGAPTLAVGAVEVLSGQFEIFGGEELCVECLLASAAIPELFRAVTVPGRGVFWDGLFSQNPPIHELVMHRIDELWLIQINSSTCARVPTETHEILDRRNALSGNLSLEQELKFIETINRAIAKGIIKDNQFRPIRVRRIVLDRELGYRSKIDRRAALLEELRIYGQTKGRLFLRDRESRLSGAVVA
jgi:NTE family protein